MFSLAEELQPNAASTASTDPFTVVLTIFCDILISYVLPTSNGLDLLKLCHILVCTAPQNACTSVLSKLAAMLKS